MPIYEFVCIRCNTKFELLRSLRQANEAADCPECQKPAKRVLSKFACFTKTASGATAPVAGTSTGCGTCGAPSCDTCH